jgi:hypothetical protein
VVVACGWQSLWEGREGYIGKYGPYAGGLMKERANSLLVRCRENKNRVWYQ